MLSMGDISNVVGRNFMDFCGKILGSDSSNWSPLPLLGAAATLTAGTAYWWLTREVEQVKHLVNHKAQTRILPDGSRVTACVKDLVAYSFEDAQTVYDSVLRGLRVSNNGPMLGYRKQKEDGSRPYFWMTYKEVLDAADKLAYAFRYIGVKTGQDAFIAISSRNRPEWVITELATYRLGAVIVPLYDTLGEEAQIFSLNQIETEIVICDTEKKALEIVHQKHRCPTVKFIVLIDDYSENLTSEATKCGIQIYSFQNLLDIGQSSPDKPQLHTPKPEDICTICYTSGTTGMPKGAILTHKNVVSGTTSHLHFTDVSSTPEDVYMSYLPLAHMYEHILECELFQTGSRVGYFSGDIRKLFDDAVALKPTVFPLVPRILNRFYDRVISDFKKNPFSWAAFSISLWYKTRLLEKGIMRNDTIFDRIFKGVRNQMGGKVRVMMTGSAPLAGEVLTFARAVLGIPILEGYGQTECSAVCSCSLETDLTTGHTGIPLFCCAVKLVDVPELNYYVKDGAGEICIKGNNVFQGYYKNEEQTKETLDDDGWLHSGDIGRWNENGCLKIVDRKKNIFKLQQGEYIAPEKIESAYAKCEAIAQSFVYGESLKTCLVGIVVPDKMALMKLASDKLGLTQLTYEELCALPSVKALLLELMVEVGKTTGLHSFEQVRDIYVTPEQFSLENDLLTPTMKNKRPQLKKYYQKQLNELYANLK